MIKNLIKHNQVIAYAVTVFLSAFLLFQVQPLMGKFILPWFGGSPAVWTTCMLVFQLLLFGGYTYAHLTTQYLKPRLQVGLHLVLLLLAIYALPIAPSYLWKPTDSTAPAARIMLLMICCVGLPYFVLSATGPLIQSWFSRTYSGQSPYRLYALSNVGSLLALLSYPFLVEPAMSVVSQSMLWSGLFVAFAVLCGYSAIRTSKRLIGRPTEQASSTLPVASRNTQRGPLTSGMLGLWFLLSMTPSILLLASTNQVCLDIAVIPFLWILPLALYLLSFILTFDSDRWYARKPYLAAAVVLQVVSVYLASRGSNVPISLQIAVYFGALFACCMVCHGELAALRPNPQHLTKYFLTISAGGAAGGLFVGLLAPMVFVAYYELQIGGLCFLLAYLCLRLREDNVRLALPGWSQPVCIAALLLVAMGCLSYLGRHQPNTLRVSRNFYGVLKVNQVENRENTSGPMLELAHGRIAHGSQFIDAARRRIPTAYYATNTGIGKLLQLWHRDVPRRIGVVGLGVGTLAAYGHSDDYFRMYEINPEVISIATQNFTFLSDSPAKQQIITGDARLSLEFEPPQNFDVLVLDAFSGDAIPIHLLTSEAMDVYMKHLQADGILACHISNLHFNLRPVIAGLAEKYGLGCRFIGSGPDVASAARPAVWALLTKAPEQLAMLDEDPLANPPQGQLIRKPIMWTDAHNNLLDVIW